MQTAKKYISTDEMVASPTLSNSVWFYFGVVAFCSFTAFAQQLLLATYGSSLMGSTLLNFSSAVALMLIAGGGGAIWIQKRTRTAATFLSIQTLSCLLAMISLPALYYQFHKAFLPSLWLLCFEVLAGFGIGAQISILRQVGNLEKHFSSLLFFVYLGGFLAGFAFPVLLLPTFGYFRTAGVLACVSAFLCLFVVTQLKKEFGKEFSLWCSLAAVICLAAIAYLVGANSIRDWMELTLFGIHHF